MKTKTILRKAAAALLLALAPAAQAMQDLGEGSMQVTGGERILPLKHTDVKAEISGFVAEVRVTQVFSNPSDQPIEAVYVFPLPENAAVNEMTLTVGDRRIKGQIKKKAEAREVYERAKAQGKTAALLDQERPNIFTQSVANLPPGKEIKVELRYIQDLGYDSGIYRFVFPMTVGPRYIPGSATGKSGTGWSPDTDQVPDASRITPPVVRPGQRSGRDISVEVKLNAGLAVKKLRSSSHETEIKDLGGNSYLVSLDEEDRIPNKDFILTYEPAVNMVGASVLAHKDGKEGYLTLMVQPDAKFPMSQVTPKELVFAIDVSGSMMGKPVEQAKAAALKCLEGMNPGDTFQILSFASGNILHFERPLKNTPENVLLGRRVIEGLSGGGGTEMLDALRKVLEFPKDPERLRIVMFMTDGYIGNDDQILGFVRDHLNNSRIFPLGVGSSVNRHLMEELAVLGRGTVQYVRQNESQASLEKIINMFYDRISKPLLTDLSVDWNGLEVTDAEASVMPDLFAGQPVFIHAKYAKAGSATVALKGKLRGNPWKMSVRVDLPEKETGNAAMAPLWARARISALSRQLYGRDGDDAKEKITMLGLEYSLVTDYTSFVAVDESTTTGNGKPLLVPVESELPEGTQYEGYFGNAAPRTAMGGVVAAMRGMLSFDKASYMTSSGFASMAGEAYLPVPEEKKEAAAKRKQAIGHAGGKSAESTAARLALELMTTPSRALARKLVSLQAGDGTFLGDDNKTVPLHEQALAVLALAKARGLYGEEMEGALQSAWGVLRDSSPAGIGAEKALRDALKGGPYFNRSAVKTELSALAGELAKLK